MPIASKASEVPKVPHYAILMFNTSSVYHEGDERSRQCPGHGYPAYTETIESFEYHYYPLTQDGHKAWTAELERLYRHSPHRTDVVAMEIGKVCKVEQHIKVV